MHVWYDASEVGKGPGGRLARVFLVTVTPPFLRLVSVGVWIWVWLCACVWVYTWMSEGFSFSHRGEGDVKVLAMLVGVEYVNVLAMLVGVEP